MAGGRLYSREGGYIRQSCFADDVSRGAFQSSIYLLLEEKPPSNGNAGKAAEEVIA